MHRWPARGMACGKGASTAASPANLPSWSSPSIRVLVLPAELFGAAPVQGHGGCGPTSPLPSVCADPPLVLTDNGAGLIGRYRGHGRVALEVTQVPRGPRG